MLRFQSRATGRLGLAALAVAALAGAFLFSRPAVAQGGVRVAVGDVNFGPTTVDPEDLQLAHPEETVLIALLLPAVQKVREAAARMQVVGDGWQFEVPLMSGERPAMRNFRLWFSRSTAADGFIVHLANEEGQTREMAVPSNQVAFRFLPAVQSDRRVYQIETATVRHNAFEQIRDVDGNEEPVLIGLLLPAIQKVR